MATVDQVLTAVERLTQTYQSMNERLNDAMAAKLIPPYKNGLCEWDGKTDFSDDSPPVTNIINMGSATHVRYGGWNNCFVMTMTQSVANTNPKSTLPVHYHVIRIKKNSDEEKKAVFIRFANADNWGYGDHSMYLVNEVFEIKKYLGTRNFDKYTGEGRSVCFDMFNNNAQTYRYNQWLAYNFDLSDAYVDEDDYVYFGISGTVNTYYIAGTGMADRNFDFEYTDSRAMATGYLPFNTSSNNGAIATGTANGLNYSRFSRNTDYIGFEFPYNENAMNKGIVVVMANLNAAEYMTELMMKCHNTGTDIPCDGISTGKYGRVFTRAFNLYGMQFMCYKIPPQELADNTVTYNGKTFVKVDIPKFLSDRDCYFTCIWTEPLED